jgi:hypothetical protein
MKLLGRMKGFVYAKRESMINVRAQHHTSCELGKRIWKEGLGAIIPKEPLALITGTNNKISGSPQNFTCHPERSEGTLSPRKVFRAGGGLLGPHPSLPLAWMASDLLESPAPPTHGSGSPQNFTCHPERSEGTLSGQRRSGPGVVYGSLTFNYPITRFPNYQSLGWTTSPSL